MVLNTIEPQPNNLMPSDDQLGAKTLIKKPEVNVPSNHSAPPHRTTQSQNNRLIK